MNKKKTVRISLLTLAAFLVILEVVAIVVARPKPAAVAGEMIPSHWPR